MFLTHSLFGQGSSAKAAAVLAMALLAGCAAGRNSVKPDAVALGPQALDAGSAVAGAALEHNQPPTASWWKGDGDGDAQLDDLVEMALAHNPTMDMAAARIRQAQGAFDTVHADIRTMSGAIFSSIARWPERAQRQHRAVCGRVAPHGPFHSAGLGRHRPTAHHPGEYVVVERLLLPVDGAVRAGAWLGLVGALAPCSEALICPTSGD